MKFEEIIDEKLIFTKMDFENTEEVIGFLSDELFKNGYVKETFKPAVIKREKKYPTGLQLGDINVAIPHTDIEHVIKSGVAVCTLSSPIKFHRMDKPGEEIPVHVVFLLAVSEPNEYVKFLSKLTSSFGKKETIRALISTDNKKQIKKILKDILKEDGE